MEDLKTLVFFGNIAFAFRCDRSSLQGELRPFLGVLKESKICGRRGGIVRRGRLRLDCQTGQARWDCQTGQTGVGLSDGAGEVGLSDRAD